MSNGSVYAHCRRCIIEKPSGQSAREWARIEVEIDPTTLMVNISCVRHELPIHSVRMHQLEAARFGGVKCTHPEHQEEKGS